MAQATGKFLYEAGILVRRKFEHEIKKMSFKLDLYVEIKDLGGGWLSSNYGVITKGEESQVREFIRHMTDFAIEMS
jgi:hypothetical protein